jgi:hypothetical protein
MFETRQLRGNERPKISREREREIERKGSDREGEETYRQINRQTQSFLSIKQPNLLQR